MNKILLALASAAFMAGTLNAQTLNFTQQKNRFSKTEKLQLNSTLSSTALQPNLKNVMKGANQFQSLNRATRATKVRDAKALSYMYPFDQYNLNEEAIVLPLATYDDLQSFYQRGYKFGYCCAFTSDITQLYAGNKITNIQFLSWYGNYDNAKAFIANETSSGIKFLWVGDVTVNPMSVTSVDCDYTITGSENLIIGYVSTLTASADDPYASEYGLIMPLLENETQSANSAFALITDKNMTNMQIAADASLIADQNGNPMYATNPIFVTTEGEAGLLPLDANTAQTLPLRTTQVDGTTTRNIQVANLGTNDINSIDYDVTLFNSRGMAVKKVSGTHNFTTPLKFLNTASVPVTTLLPDFRGWGVDSLNITKVNGQDDSYPGDNVSQCVVYSLGDQAYKRKALVEEWTNTACGYCPRGIVGMDALEQEYEQGNPEEENDVNILTYHSNIYSANDPWADATAEHAAWQFGLSLPSAYINRVYNTDPFYGDNQSATKAADGIVATVKEYLKQNPVCEATIGVTSELDEANNVLTVTSSTRFSTPTQNGEYSVGYVLTESGLTAPQTNYYSGQSQQYANTELSQLCSKGQTYTATYNNVSRYCTNPQGYIVEQQGQQLYLTGYYDAANHQLPGTTVQDKGLMHTAEIQLPANFDKSTGNVVAVLYDNKTREVVNSACAWINYTSTGIENNTAAAPEALVKVQNGAFNVTAHNAKAEVFALDGKLVTSATVNGTASLPTFGKGVFIIRVTENGKVFTKKAAF